MAPAPAWGLDPRHPPSHGYGPGIGFRTSEYHGAGAPEPRTACSDHLTPVESEPISWAIVRRFRALEGLSSRPGVRDGEPANQQEWWSTRLLSCGRTVTCNPNRACCNAAKLCAPG